MSAQESVFRVPRMPETLAAILRADLAKYEEALEKARKIHAESGREVASLELQVRVTRETLAGLEGGMPATTLLRPGEFSGRDVIDAVVRYLELRKEAGRVGPVPIKAELVDALVHGGLFSDTGGKHIWRITRMTISKNAERKNLLYDPTADTVELR